MPLRMLRGFAAFLFACQIARAAELKPISLPDAEGIISGIAFSPDSTLIAIVRSLVRRDSSDVQHTIQIVDVKSRRQVAYAVLLDEGSYTGPEAYRGPGRCFVGYSFDGHYLLLAPFGSDVVLMVDAVQLKIVTRVIFHPDASHRRSLYTGTSGPFRGIVAFAAASSAGVFGVLTHDGLGVNEVFIGTLPGQIIKSWSFGHGPVRTQLGGTSLFLSETGSRVAVSLLPDTGTAPKNFNGLRVYESATGRLIAGIPTKNLLGQIALVGPEGVLTSRIDTPSVFTKTTCMDEWDLSKGSLAKQFCDRGRHVIGLGASATASVAASWAGQIHRDLEGNVYALPGRLDVWDVKSGALIAFSADFPKAPSDVIISPNGSWLSDGEALFEIQTSVKPQH